MECVKPGDMVEKMMQLDRSLFLFLNGMHTPLWDYIMYFISGKFSWLPLYLFILYLLFRSYRKKGFILLLGAVILITLSDQLSVQAFKEVFERLRPCHEPALAGQVHTVNGQCGGAFGFVSSHASNVFALAAWSHLLLRRQWYAALIFLWASLVSYSRIYLGVHYPADVLGGAVLGICTGWAVYRFYRFVDRKYLHESQFFTS
jgi:undecaprenyl-diphosphatase